MASAGQNRRLLLRLLCVAVPLLAVAAGVLLLAPHPAAAVTRSDTAPTPTEAPAASAFNGTVQRDGVTYALNQNLTTVLILGIDNSNVAEQTNTAVMAGAGYSDMMLLAILDDETETTRLLQISRDCMQPIDLYDALGRPLRSVTQQLCYQYAYGSSRAESCRLTRGKVSELLYGAPVDSAFALQMEGFVPLVELLGGLELTIPEDYTYIDPAFTAGTTLTLTGSQTLAYVRWRDTTELGSNNARMARQTQVLRALAAKLQAGGTDLAEQMMKIADPYLQSDVDAETLQKLASYTLEQTIYNVPGTTRAGTHDEYIVDEQALRELVITLFYAPADN